VLPASLGAPVAREPLTHGSGNAATGGIWRVTGTAGTAILKVAHPPGARDGSPSWQTSDEPTHWNYWRRESLALGSGFAHTALAGSGIAAPRVLEVVEAADGAVALWLAEVAGTHGPQWTVDRYGEFARRLGVVQARYADRVPDEPWLSRDWLAQYVAARHFPVPVPGDWALTGWPDRVVSVLAGLWDRRDSLVARARRGPRTLCHLDVWPMNLIDTSSGFVLLDWAFVGEGAIGEDIANLVIDSVTDGLVDGRLLPAIADTAIEGYLSGLRSGGWRGSPDAVRDAIAACGAAKYCWFAPAIVARAARDGDVNSPSYGRHGSTAAAFAGLTDLAMLIADWSTPG